MKVTVTDRGNGQISIRGVRLSFFNGFVARAAEEGQKAKFNTSGLIPKEDESAAKAIRKAMIDVAKAKWGDKAKKLYDSLDKSQKLAFKDGDAKAAEKPETYGSYEDMYFITAASDSRPQVVDKDRSPLTQEDGKPYSGCYPTRS